ncbi:MAG: MlaD family protein [Opitutales bacterium]
MSKRANPAAVGLFVFGALFLGFAAIVVFGSGKFFQTRQAFILYFEDSVQGLNVGAPVKFKGVTIGEVTDIFIRYRQPADSPHVPVIIEIDTEGLQEKHNVLVDLADPDELARQILNGLRAALQQDSFVTGRLYIELDYYPDLEEPPEMVQSAEGPDDQPAYLEIPTLRFGLTEVLQKLTRMVNDVSQIDFPGIANDARLTINNANSLLSEVNAKVRQLDVNAINREVVMTLEQVRVLVEDPALSEVGPNLNDALKQVQSLTTKVDANIDPLMADLSVSLEQARTTLREAELLLADLNASAGTANSPLQRNLNRSLEEVAAAARSLNQLANYLERNPSALLTGRNASE